MKRIRRLCLNTGIGCHTHIINTYNLENIDNRKIKVKVGGKENYSLNTPTWFRPRAGHLETFQHPRYFIQEGIVF